MRLILVVPLLIISAIKCEQANNTNITGEDRDTSSEHLSLNEAEYVDHTESPIPLFDSIDSSDRNLLTTQSPPRSDIGHENDTTLKFPNDNISSKPSDVLPAPSDSSESDGEGVEETDGGSSDRFEEESSTNKFEAPKNVSQYMDYIEKLLHDLRHQITDLFEPHIPQLIRTSQMVELSSGCSHDMLRMALALRQFEPWALKMIDSSGKVPEGVFEGSFTALGSYDQCLNIIFASSSSQVHINHSSTSLGQSQTQGKYCLVNLSPYLPPKPTPAAIVDQLFQEEANRRNYSKDDQLSRLSPVFYYMKFRIGICVPSTCNDSDMESISNALSSSLRLNITINTCGVKQSQPVTTHQVVGGSLVGLIVAVVMAATLFDYSKMSWEKVIRQQKEIVLLSVNNLDIRSPTGKSDFRDGTIPMCQEEQRSEADSVWRSFSILVNFGLYFRSRSDESEQKSRCIDMKCQDSCCRAGCHCKPHGQTERSPTVLINCLNGIRVLSLCWVIVANSYITLDPRATKRLTKTREAPRDFLFQMIAQASLAIETFFFLSGLLMSVSFARKFKLIEYADSRSQPTRTSHLSHMSRWIRFYLHRYVRLTPPTMLVIAFTMFAFRFGDGPLWMEVTHKAHQSCGQNWWRHLLHVANYIDTRQMCFIHYWYIAADMQLFLLAPVLLFLIYRYKILGYLATSLIGGASIIWVFHTTYSRNLPPTLLFYSSDPETRREFGNAIMTKPLTHVLPYMVGMLLGKWLISRRSRDDQPQLSSRKYKQLLKLWGFVAFIVAISEIFLPYSWNNSELPSPLLSSLYAALFRLGWSISLAYLVISCGHKSGKHCITDQVNHRQDQQSSYCFCGSGGGLMNRFLSLNIFTHLSKLSFVAYLIHLPLMSLFVAQTRGLFAFSHLLVIHLALSYLLMTFILSFVLVHLIEFPFITLERHFFSTILARKLSSADQ